MNAAAYLEAGHEFGRVEEGLSADLLLLTGNPLEDIEHVAALDGVMVRGQWIPADSLDAALERLAEARQ